MHSKGYHRLINRLNDFMCDYEFAQVIFSCRNLIKAKDKVFQYVDLNKHPELSKHDATPQARTIIVNHLKSTLAVSFIKEAYEELTEYLHYTLNQGAKSGQIKPERISDSVKINLTANQLLSTNSHEEVINLVTTQIYKSLESERSTIELIKKICKRLDLNVNEDIIKDAIKYLDMRHIFVHTDGKPNKEYRVTYPDIKLNFKGRINLTLIDLHQVRDSIKNLAFKIDQELINKNLILESEKQP